MASEEHKRLASFIKSVHKTLRTASCDRAPEEVWAEHLAKEALLQEYARSMQELATAHWTDATEESSRINWTWGQIISYFRAGGREHQHGRDFKFARKKGVNWEIPSQSQSRQRLRILDVGSCYNPFSQFEDFDVLAIDIAPAQPSVIKCDFLQVTTGQSNLIEDNSVKSLEAGSYDAVLFCLLLEYLPSASQRYECVRKSIELLSEDGLLCIITPDSSHQGKNLQQLKSWRRALNLLGLRQVTYSKTRHFHGLVFRKPCQEIRALTAEEVQDQNKAEKIENMFYIPQDFTENGSVMSTDLALENLLENLNRDIVVSDFDELPSLDF